MIGGGEVVIDAAAAQRLGPGVEKMLHAFLVSGAEIVDIGGALTPLWRAPRRCLLSPKCASHAR